MFKYKTVTITKEVPYWEDEPAINEDGKAFNGNKVVGGIAGFITGTIAKIKKKVTKQ